jgi:hypothetical protein
MACTANRFRRFSFGMLEAFGLSFYRHAQSDLQATVYRNVKMKNDKALA